MPVDQFLFEIGNALAKARQGRIDRLLQGRGRLLVRLANLRASASHVAQNAACLSMICSSIGIGVGTALLAAISFALEAMGQFGIGILIDALQQALLQLFDHRVEEHRHQGQAESESGGVEGLV